MNVGGVRNVSVSQSWIDEISRERQDMLRKLERQTDEIARLTAQRAELKTALDASDDQHREALAEIARLREALRPFAALARTYRDETGEFGKPDARPVFGVNDTHLTVGDMRAAIKALEGT